MKTSELREAFLNFFKEKKHEVVSSSSLVPTNDPTLLFTNAGMVQFKDVFLGKEQRSIPRATSSQRCVRAGGKHNDLENVGYTARHHTFFEMLGNFSFGDYFKREAIQYAWEFVTQVLKLPEERLWITIYQEDDEAADIWLNEMGVSPERFSRCGEKDNFWSMGETGPCGPCSEIFYDHGPEVPGGPPGSPDEEGDRYIEIWNLVFMQYNRAADGSLNPLPKPSVDTGMGLERVAAIMQGVHSNYDIDLFKHLIQAIAKVTGASDMADKSLRVIADHCRSCAFLVVDGVLPSNEGRGYVLRRIMRRAIRHGQKLGVKDIFFHQLVKPLVGKMGEQYPELNQSQAHIEKVFKQEEEQFNRTLEQGLKILEQGITELKGTTISGEMVFKLYDTYGFPVDLTNDIARERGLTIDRAGFEQAMEKQRENARGASQFAANLSDAIVSDVETVFTGYEQESGSGQIDAIWVDGKSVERISKGDEAQIILKETPFYAESGGQVGDKGQLLLNDAIFKVNDTQKAGKAFLHIGQLIEGQLSVGNTVQAEVSHQVRQATRLNHSATHLMHAALRQVLGTHVEQKGSVVDSARLRFDFSHFEPVSIEQLQAIEDLVNAEVRRNSEVLTRVMPIKEAKAAGAMALFGEKYEAKVRVLSMGGDFSVELCGGTHVSRTGDIGYFKITQETGIASGVRRIEAITGEKACFLARQSEQTLTRLSGLLKSSPAALESKLEQTLSKMKQLEKQLEKAKKEAAGGSQDLGQSAKTIGEAQVVVAKLPVGDPKSLREISDNLKNQLSNAVILLSVVTEDNKVHLISGVSKNMTAKIKAGELVNMVAQQVGGKGGGRPDMAQAGGSQPENLEKALESVYDWISERV